MSSETIFKGIEALISFLGEVRVCALIHISIKVLHLKPMIMNYLPCLVCLEWCLNVSQSNVQQPAFQTHALCLLLRLCKIRVKSSLHYNTIENNINQKKYLIEFHLRKNNILSFIEIIRG